jgi:hypothetical protein
MHNGSRHSVSIWVAAFALTAALQIFRGSLGDTIIFLGGTVILLLSTTALSRFSFPSSKLISTKSLEWAGFILLICLAFTPRHSFFNLGIFVLMLPVALALAWGEHTEPISPLTKRDRATRNLWIGWAVTMCIWEFGANIFGQLLNNAPAFPTLSVLIDPLLKVPLGQAGFVAVWLTVGYFLITAGSE